MSFDPLTMAHELGDAAAYERATLDALERAVEAEVLRRAYFRELVSG